MVVIEKLICAFIVAEPKLNDDCIACAILEEYPELGKLGKTVLIEMVGKTRETPMECAHPVTRSEEHARIDSIVKDYVVSGNNMSGEEIIRKYSMSQMEWLALKNFMNLHKFSKIGSSQVN